MTNQKQISITIDTSSLIDWMDGKGFCTEVEQIIDWHDKGFVDVCISSRVENLDILRMNSKGRQSLQQKLKGHGIETTPSTFRWSISLWGGPDVWAGPSERSEEDLEKFQEVVGIEPTDLPQQNVGSKLSNKIGDYDALRDHYATKRDVFITNENGDYFNKNSREKYQAELGLTIQNPQEFVESFTETMRKKP